VTLFTVALIVRIVSGSALAPTMLITEFAGTEVIRLDSEQII
jgi:hypothetical protein